MTSSPLASGFLSGKYSRENPVPEGGRRAKFDFPPVDIDKGYKVVAALRPIAQKHQASIAQVALAWVLAQGKDIVPIPGTTIPEHLKENVEALNIKLSEEDLAEINQVMPEGVASGLRYPESMMHLVNG